MRLNNIFFADPDVSINSVLKQRFKIILFFYIFDNDFVFSW